MLVFSFVVAFDLPIAYFPLVNISAVSKVVARPTHFGVNIGQARRTSVAPSGLGQPGEKSYEPHILRLPTFARCRPYYMLPEYISALCPAIL